MKVKRALLAAALVLVIPCTLPAEEPVIVEIRALYREAKEFQRSEVVLPETWVRLWDEARGQPSDWQVWMGRPGGEPAMARLDLYLARRAVVSAVLFETSPSGDWAKHTEYYFWDGGATAFIYAQLRTFNGSAIVERRHYYDREGREVRALKSVRDLTTGQALADQPGAYLDNPPGLYLSATELLAGLDVRR